MPAIEVTDQRMQALEIANERRLNGAAVKRALAQGLVTFAEVLDDPRAQQTQVGQLLLAQPRWGHTKASKLLKRLEIWPQRRVRDLTERQKARLKAATS